MIHTDIWVSEQVSRLSVQARLLFVGIITIADDDGRLKGNPSFLRSQIYPYDDDIKVDNVRKWLDEILEQKLVASYIVDESDYLYLPKWGKFQTLRNDRRKPSTIPQPNDNQVATNGQPDGGQFAAKGKVREGKVSKENTLEGVASMKYLDNIPQEDMKEFVTRFEITPGKVRSVAEDLVLYCQRKGKTYKNYKAFLLNAIKRDHRQRPAPKPPEPPEPVLSKEQIAANKKKMDEIRESLGGKFRIKP